MVVLIVIAFIAGSFAGLATIEMLYNDGWLFAFKLLAIIEAIAVPIVLYIWRNQLREYFSWNARTTVFVGAGLCGMGLLMGAPYVFLLNAATSSGESVKFEGPVLSKCSSSGKGTTYIIEIADHNSALPVKLTASREEYESIKVGETVSRCMQIGGLGIPYRWRYSSVPTICAT